MLFQLIIGLIILILGAEALVSAVSRIAELLGISPLIIGLTIVAFGTSSPELVVSIKSSLSGQADLAVGNVLGSNIFNVLCILGISAIIAPLVVSRQLIRLDVPIMIVVSVIVYLFSLNNKINALEGWILFVGILAYTAFQIYLGRNQGNNPTKFHNEKQKPNRKKSIVINITLSIVGFILLIVGSEWFINASIEIARELGVSELVIGLTLVAAGTSLPELATSVLSSIRGKCDIAVGNIVGSNIFNLLGVLGVSAIFSPDGINILSSTLNTDFLVMIATAVACLPVFFTGHLIARWEGILFFGYYVLYLVYLFMGVQHIDKLQNINLLILVFVIPIMVITFIIFTIRSKQNDKKSDLG